MRKRVMLLAAGLFIVSLIFVALVLADSNNAPTQDYKINPIISTYGSNHTQANCTSGSSCTEEYNSGNKSYSGENNSNSSERAIQERNKLRAHYENQSECPDNCTCTGSVVKCELNGGRIMTILAGKSGNTIIQVKGVNMTTNVTLYQHNGKVYGVFKGNKTEVVNMLPDQVQEKLTQKINAKLEIRNMTLDNNGTYHVEAAKEARLFFIFPVKEGMKTEVNSQTGEVMKTRGPWWGFLARDVREAPLLGASCGTVTPGQNNACCQSRGYDYWNQTRGECLFNITQGNNS